MKMKPRIVVVGMGEIGSAFAFLLRRAGRSIDCWDACPGKVKGQKSLFEIVPNAEIVFLCVPSWHLSDAVMQMRPFMRRTVTVVSVSKGLQETGETSYAFLTQELQAAHVVYIGGAMLAEELHAGLPGFGVVVGGSETACTRVRHLFDHTNLFLERSDDSKGVVFASVLKNIYALGLGITQGLEWGSNTRAWFAVRAMDEMARAVVALGGTRGSVHSYAGVVDLIATGFSPLSKNVEVGSMLVKRKKTLPPSEGFVSIQPLMKLLPEKELHALPLMRAIARVVSGREPARIAFPHLLKHS